jgi:hypothetical protein
MDKPESKSAVDYQKYQAIRDRWDKEDSLLNSRTGIFLTTNSILFAASQFQTQEPAFQVGAATIGFALSILWLTTSWHTSNVIKELFLMCKDDTPYNLIRIYRVKPILFRPTTVFSKLIPSLIITGWIAYIIWILVSYF